MKLATLKNGRDGALLVVSRDLQWALEVPHIAPTLQAALDHWAETEVGLSEAYRRLNAAIDQRVVRYRPVEVL